MSKLNRNFKGIWIPKEIWLSKDLTLQEKVFLVEIESLDNEKGCYANNEYFSNFFRLSKTRVSLIIKSLINKGFIKSTLIYKEGTKQILNRVIKVCYTPSLMKVKDPIQQKLKDNNTLNNTLNNTIKQSINLIPKNQKNDFQADDSENYDPFQLTILDEIDKKGFYDECTFIDQEYVNKLIEKEKPKFSKEVLNCYRVCLEYFEEHLHPKNPKSWYEVIEKLNRIDKIPFAEIERITKLAREDDFWSKNFLSLKKLRMKNKEKIPYIVVFSEKFKSKSMTINRQSKEVIEDNLKDW